MRQNGSGEPLDAAMLADRDRVLGAPLFEVSQARIFNAGVIQMTKALALERAHYGFRVNARSCC
jgi:NAD(P)-dependent dehydrogenase (short-subunit alcohol dehydrogenase family)